MRRLFRRWATLGESAGFVYGGALVVPVRRSLFAVHCSQSLVDPDYLYRYNYYPNQIKSDTLFYEKATLNRWLATVVPSSTRMTAK